eukprot:CAMPEP_0176476774 /NCGR_PEP_ID=MMETSP0200_2-20121128/241_1 /TAXON_ID=947934 /ORGANISM="Chaetoceros sp., Strain GSL56" /LENGTH=718 /DNA_ID=CAMNT_0017872485 /DNA_START=560 /DNA_END=2716 /DNA_ORIENTATION=-
MVITNELHAESLKNETFPKNREEEKNTKPDNVTSSDEGVFTFHSGELRHEHDDKDTQNVGMAKENTTNHYDMLSKNWSMSDTKFAAKRILEGLPSHTPSHWMHTKHDNVLSFQKPQIDPMQQPFASFLLPQGFEYNTSLSYPYAYRRHLPDTTPSIFQNTPLRRGKWTVEEETYANAIIETFEKGTLQGCENGCTLRSYLSRKLHCQPMRISKKYAGKSIGKQVFLSRLNSPPGRRMACVDSAEKLRNLEFQFHMSLIQESSSASGTDVCSLPIYHDCVIPTSLDRNSDMQQLRFNNNNGSIHDHKSLPSSNSNASGNFHKQTHPAAKTQNVKNEYQVGSESFPNASKMCNDLFNALQQAQSTYLVCNMNSKTFPDSESQVHVKTTRIENENLSSSNSVESCDDLMKNVNYGQAQSQENWINETMAMIPSLDPSKHDTNAGRSTPTYTSKSFDDLHQFIGKGLPSFDSEKDRSKSKHLQEKFTGPASSAANNLMRDLSQTIVFHQPTVAQFTDRVLKTNNRSSGSVQTNFISDADEYAYLAKQSAIEASRHSAYHLPLTGNVPNTLSTNQKDTQNIAQGPKLSEQHLHQNEPMTIRNSNPDLLLEKDLQKQKRLISETHRVSPVSAETPWTSNLTSESSFLMNIPIVSGSERSSSEIVTEHSSGSHIHSSGLNTSSDDSSDSTSGEEIKANYRLGNGKRILAENSEKQSNRKKAMSCQ